MKKQDIPPILVDTAGLSKMLSLSPNSAVAVGDSAKARVCYGRRVLWSVKAIQDYIDNADGILKA